MTVPCKYCGRPIIWGTSRDGKNIPLDPRAPVFAVVAIEYPAGISEEIIRVQQCPTLKNRDPERHMRHYDGQWLMGAYVSHFSTCTKVPK